MEKKLQINITVSREFAEQYDVWCDKFSGTKTQKGIAAVKAIQALSEIDPKIVMQLMQPNVSVERAKEIIFEDVTTVKNNLLVPLLKKKLNLEQKTTLIQLLEGLGE